MLGQQQGNSFLYIPYLSSWLGKICPLFSREITIVKGKKANRLLLLYSKIQNVWCNHWPAMRGGFSKTFTWKNSQSISCSLKNCNSLKYFQLGCVEVLLGEGLEQIRQKNLNIYATYSLHREDVSLFFFCALLLLHTLHYTVWHVWDPLKTFPRLFSLSYIPNRYVINVALKLAIKLCVFLSL